MKTLLLNVPSFSGKIVSPTWIKAVMVKNLFHLTESLLKI